MAPGVYTGTEITAVLVSHNSGAVIGDALSSFRSLLPNAPAIVVDNASTDMTLDTLTNYSGVRVVRVSENSGFARACNLGANLVHTEFLLFLNPDATLVAVDDRTLRREMASRPFGVGAVGHDHHSFSEVSHDVFRQEGKTRGLAWHLVQPFWPRSLGDSWWAPRAGEDWAGGAFLLLRTPEFLSVGGFDERFFLYYEDTELSWRMRRLGHRVSKLYGLVAAHKQGTSCQGGSLSVDRAGIAFLSWVQLLAIQYGPRVARRYSRAALTGFRAQAMVSSVFEKTPLRAGRLAQKLAAQKDLLGFLANSAPSLFANGFYPDAVTALGLRMRAVDQ